MNPFFSMASVRRLQPLIQERVDTLLDRINGFGVSGDVLNFSWAYTALANGMHTARNPKEKELIDVDVVMEYIFSRSDRRLGIYLFISVNLLLLILSRR